MAIAVRALCKPCRAAQKHRCAIMKTGYALMMRIEFRPVTCSTMTGSPAASVSISL
jgi:hypothetical protein